MEVRTYETRERRRRGHPKTGGSWTLIRLIHKPSEKLLRHKNVEHISLDGKVDRIQKSRWTLVVDPDKYLESQSTYHGKWIQVQAFTCYFFLWSRPFLSRDLYI